MAGIIDDVSQFFQQNFPAINNARLGFQQRVTGNINRGDYVRAAGNVVGGAVQQPFAATDDFVLRPIRSVLGSAAPFVGGIFGSEGSTKVAPAVAAVPAAPVARVAQPVEQALSQGRRAEVQVTSADRLNAYISDVLKNGATIREVQALGGLVPALAKPGQSTKNQVLGQTAALSQAIFEDQMTKIAAAAEAGTLTPEQRTIGEEKATAAYFQRNGGLVGFDPTKLAQAQLLDPTEED